MDASSFRNVLKYMTPKNDPVFQALRVQPWQIDRDIDAHGCESNPVVIAWCQLIVGNFPELASPQQRQGEIGQLLAYIRHHVLEPRVKRQQFGGPCTRG